MELQCIVTNTMFVFFSTPEICMDYDESKTIVVPNTTFVFCSTPGYLPNQNLRDMVVLSTCTPYAAILYWCVVDLHGVYDSKVVEGPGHIEVVRAQFSLLQFCKLTTCTYEKYQC